MKKNWILGISVIVFVLLFWMVKAKWHKQKVAGEKTANSLRSAGDAISKARVRHAFVYAPGLFTEGEEMYEAAMQQWRNENDRWYFSRDYDTVIQLAANVETKVALALKKAGEHRNKFQKDFEILVVELSGKIKDFESFYSFLPLPDEIRNKFVKGRIMYSESQKAGDKGAFNQAYSKAKDASLLINPAHKYGEDKLHNYFSLFPQWAILNKEALKLSHSRRVIMVDKIARRCYVYKNSKTVQTYTIELGKNWVGTKVQQGDKSTPEGKYHITKKLKGSQTIYYKALLINYPNDDDKERFANNKAAGTIPPKARIGGLIEIHGGGGKGTDWTEGCIGLNDKDMDKLFGLVNTGTPVFIVGSLVSLDKLKNRDSIKSQDDN